jgi:D-lactate dehydrogenase
MKALFTECKEGDLDFYPSALPEIEVQATRLTLEEAHPDQATTILSVMVHSPVGESEMDQLPNLRLITTRSTGFDHIDLATASSKAIVVCNIPDYGSRTVAEHTILLLLAIMRKLPAARVPIDSGQFSLEGLLGFDLFGKTLGVLGTGLIGGEVARMAQCLGMRTIGFDPQPSPGKVDQYVTFDALLAESDAVAICCPLNSQTRHMIGREEFAKMKRGVFIVNTGRGAIIDSTALLNALDSGQVSALVWMCLNART